MQGRALDARSPLPVLGGAQAAVVADGFGDVLASIRFGAGVRLGTALRNAVFDRRVREFVRAHPDAVVVELGFGTRRTWPASNRN